jgi:hypothetical protein
MVVYFVNLEYTKVTTICYHNKFKDFPIALKGTYAIDKPTANLAEVEVQKSESNIIEFKKPIKDVDRNQKEEKVYDSLFTPELHKELLAQARKDYEQ